MKNVSVLVRFGITAVAVAAALWVGFALWNYYMNAPWTRDGRVRADVVTIAPDVSGFVTEVLVKDNHLVALNAAPSRRYADEPYFEIHVVSLEH